MRQIVVAKTFLADPDGNILVLRRSATDPKRAGGWDIPGGWVEQNEEFSAAAAREMLEEAGIAVPAGELQLSYAKTIVGDMVPAEQISINRLFFTAKTASNEVLLSDEHDAFQWLSPNDAAAVLTHPPQAEALAYILQHSLLQ